MFSKMARVPSFLWQNDIPLISNSTIQFSRSVWLFSTTWTTALHGSLSITNSRSLLKLMSIESVMPSNHLILCHPLLLPPSIFPSLFTQFYTHLVIAATISSWKQLHPPSSAHQVAKVLEFQLQHQSFQWTPMNTQDWSSLGWTGWISLQSKGLWFFSSVQSLSCV